MSCGVMCVSRAGWEAERAGPRTRWFVRMALPSLHLTEKGSLPGKEFGVCSVNAVRGGEVKRVFSLGRGTKVWGPSSMTQLVLSARILPPRVLWRSVTDFMDMMAWRWKIW